MWERHQQFVEFVEREKKKRRDGNDQRRLGAKS
jgi:hypothetical protein